MSDPSHGSVQIIYYDDTAAGPARKIVEIDITGKSSKAKLEQYELDLAAAAQKANLNFRRTQK